MRFITAACQGSSPLGILREEPKEGGREEEKERRKHETNAKRRTVFPAAGPERPRMRWHLSRLRNFKGVPPRVPLPGADGPITRGTRSKFRPLSRE